MLAYDTFCNIFARGGLSETNFPPQKKKKTTRIHSFCLFFFNNIQCKFVCVCGFFFFFFNYFYNKCFIFSNIVITIIITRCTNLSLFTAGFFSFSIFHFPLLHFFKLSFFSFFFFFFNVFSYFVLAFNIFTPLFLYVSFHPIDILHILKCVFEHSIFIFVSFYLLFYYFSRFS